MSLLRQLLLFIALIVLGSTTSYGSMHQTCPDMSHNKEPPTAWKLVLYKKLPQGNNVFTHADWNREENRWGIVCNYNIPETGYFFQLWHDNYRPDVLARTHWKSSLNPNFPCNTKVDTSCRCRGRALEDCRIDEMD